MSDAVRTLFGRTAPLAIFALAACQFDGSALDARPPCTVDDDCPGTLTCVSGSCSEAAAIDAGVADDTAGADADGDTGTDAAEDAGIDVVPTECDPGTAVCIGQIARFCDANGNVESEINCAAAASCPGVELGCACSEGECLPRSCRAGTRTCDGDDVTLCSNDGLTSSVIEACADSGRACIGGACVVTECTGDETLCSGTAVVECRDNVLVEVRDCVESAERCVEDDDGAACTARLCEPGVAYCDETFSAIRYCNDDGSAFDRTESCGTSAYCSTEPGVPTCVAEACEPSEVRCAPGAERVETCTARGDGWTETRSCDAGQFCNDGACLPQVCPPSSATCLDLDTRRLCDARGATITESNCTFDRFCRDGDCIADVCTAGELRCAGAATREVCDTFGSAWQAATACADRTTCTDGDCVPLVCEPGAAECDGNTAVRCNADGTAEARTPCGSALTCVAGACADRVCMPGTRSCGESGQVIQCNEAGTGTTTVESCPFGCSGGVCQPARCGDGVVSAERGETCDDANAAFCDGCESCQRRGVMAIGPTTRTTTTRSHNIASSDFTVEAWVNVSGNDGVFAGVSAAPGGPGDFAAIGVSGGRPYFEFGLGTGATPVRAQASGVIRGTGWHHVAGVRFARHWAVLFVDGTLAAFSHPNLSFSSCDTDRFFIGGAAGLGFAGVDALVDEVRLVSRREYVREFAPARRIETTDAATVAVYGFDDGDAARIDDRGPAGNDLVLENALWVADSCFGSSPLSIACGDGQRAPWEACDDNNLTGSDGCSPSCQREPNCSGAGRTLGARGECYTLVSAGANWNAARNACASASATLVSIDDEYEQAFLRGFVATGSTAAWIGLNDRDTEGTFTWTGGSTSTFRFWNSGEPNNFGSGEDCAQMSSGETGGWNDFGCDNSLPYICESRAW